MTGFKEYVARRQLAEAASGVRRLGQGGVFNEMAAARRSFKHSMGKFEPQVVDKPIAILTAWRGTLHDRNGQPYPEAVRRRVNDKANELLKANIRRRGLSFYPVVGAGQELIQGITTMNKENSFIVQPVGKIDYDDFRNHVRELLFNPTGEPGNGPFVHTQYSAIIKLPNDAQAYELHFPDTMKAPTGPQDYTEMDPKGDSAVPRVQQEPGYTQMKYGPRADPAMMDALDQPGDVGDIGGLPGKRFTVKDRGQP